MLQLYLFAGSRPSLRSEEDLEIIYKQLRRDELFPRFPATVIQQLCYSAFIEHVDKGIVG